MPNLRATNVIELPLSSTDGRGVTLQVAVVRLMYAHTGGGFAGSLSVY